MEELKYKMVEYSNEFSTATTGFSAYDLDVFLVLTYLARQKIPNASVNLDEKFSISLSLKEVKQILRNTGNANQKRIEKSIQNLFDAKFFFKRDKYIQYHHLFDDMKVHTERDEIFLTIRKEYVKLFFNLTGNFTQHSILEFNSLRGRYSKRLYQIIMAYKELKSLILDATIFRTMLEIPKAYNWTDVERTFKNSIEELHNKTEIKNFEFVRIKEGRKITKIELKWDLHKTKEILTEDSFIKTDVHIKKEDESKKEVKQEINQLSNKPLEEHEEEVLEWLFNLYPEYKPPFKKDHPLYNLAMRKILYNLPTDNKK